jgi:hypothetical protein
MEYEILLRTMTSLPNDLELLHENPLSACGVFEDLRKRYGEADLAILREGVEITPAELASDVESYEIRRVMEEDSHLPSTYRHGRGGDSDLALGTDGNRHGVWKPMNPEDDYD